jgi:hypothetical protein
MIRHRQARTCDIRALLLYCIEMTGRASTLPWRLGGEGVKTTEKKYIGPVAGSTQPMFTNKDNVLQCTGTILHGQPVGVGPPPPPDVILFYMISLVCSQCYTNFISKNVSGPIEFSADCVHVQFESQKPKKQAMLGGWYLLKDDNEYIIFFS